MADHVDLYDLDFFAWTQDQAARLRHAAASRVDAPIDWEHVAEEIEDLGKALRRDVKSHVRTIIEHLVMLQHPRVQGRRPDSVESVMRSRHELAYLFKQSPSLRLQVGEFLPSAQESALKVVRASIVEYGAIGASDAAAIGAEPLTQDEVLGDWFPPPPAEQQRGRKK